MRPFRQFLAAVALAALPACAATPAPRPAPSATASGDPFVIAANPLAAEAGLNVLKRGGSAVDAAIAVQAMLSLVEPQSSGVGGGAFMTYFGARTGKITIYDGREVAPAQATPGMFLDAAGQPLPFNTAVVSGRATGVPGAVKMLALAHGEHGKLPWSSLFGDAERTADQGFIVSPRLSRMIHADFAENHQPDVIAYFSKPDGGLLNVGDRLVNKPYADFLRRLASQGPAALYAGSTAAKIVARTHAGPLAGAMTMADLANYRPIRREPVCGPFRVYLLCAPPPPSSGVGLIELMMMLDRTDIAARGPGDPQSWFLFAEASRLMYADRDKYVGDPAFVKVPVNGMIEVAYVASRARLIGTSAGPPPEAGRPELAPLMAADNTLEPTGTSHFIVRDADGNVVSMTTTVEFDLRHRPNGRWLLPQQPADRFLLLAGRRAGAAGRERCRAGQASALIDGALDLAYERRQVRRRDWFGRRQFDPRFCRQVAGRLGRLEHEHGRRARRAQPRRARPQLQRRGDQILPRDPRGTAPARDRPQAGAG